MVTVLGGINPVNVRFSMARSLIKPVRGLRHMNVELASPCLDMGP